MMTLWRELLLSLRAMTARERAGLAMLAALLVTALAAGSLDWALGAGLAAHEAQARHAQAAATLARDSDPAFQESLAVETNKVWRWSIVEASEGVAQAQAIAALEGVALQAGLANVAVTAGELAPRENSSAVRPLSLTLSADFDWASFLALLEAMQATDLSLTLEAVEVAADQDQAPTLTMRLRAPFMQEAQ